MSWYKFSDCCANYLSSPDLNDSKSINYSNKYVAAENFQASNSVQKQNKSTNLCSVDIR